MDTEPLVRLLQLWIIDVDRQKVINPIADVRVFADFEEKSSPHLFVF